MAPWPREEWLWAAESSRNMTSSLRVMGASMRVRMDWWPGRFKTARLQGESLLTQRRMTDGVLAWLPFPVSKVAFADTRVISADRADYQASVFKAFARAL